MSNEPWQVSQRLVEVWQWKDAIAQKLLICRSMKR